MAAYGKLPTLPRRAPARLPGRPSDTPPPPGTPGTLPPSEPALAGPDPCLASIAATWLAHAGATPVAQRLSVVWNPRLQTTAGTACARTSVIELNPRLDAISHSQVLRTLRHEAAHLLAHWRAGRRRIKVHGPEWRQACADLGIPGEPACHDLPLPRRKVTRKYTYQCPACFFVAHRVRPFSRYTACYRCCQRHNHGRYDHRFRFVLTSDPVRPA